MSESAYAAAGVDIAAASRAKEMMRDAVRATFGPEVLSDVGSFGGLYDAAGLKAMSAPVLVASTDGVGTKTQVAAWLGRWETIGHDLVNHCANDILVQGARPLFFLDYIAAARLDPAQVAVVVTGVADACRALGCALLGGETAEMPGVYEPGALDLAGTIVGVVDRAALIDGHRIREGDAILGLPSTGLHTNGYSLARRVLAELDWDVPRDDLGGVTVGEALLRPHRAYVTEIAALRAEGLDVRGLSHITGGGLVDNPPRVFPAGLGARLWRGNWPAEPPIFGLIQSVGGIDPAEMVHVFNMGLGMLVILPAEQAAAAQALVPELAVVGEMVAGPAEVHIV
jgi:phosphoribosylformylglycinamidine cyclo-ligase